ncbi:MAG: hypothetical protein ACPG77_09735 [Nannocystaceae bacterium]
MFTLATQPLRTLLLATLTSVGLGCGDTGQVAFEHPISAQAAAGASEAFEVEGWEIVLTQADVGIGPMYFCASVAASSELCPSAVAEWTDAAAIDALDASSQPLGEVSGITGTVRPVTYDFAISWFATQTDPVPAQAAPGGHSIQMAGVATRLADARQIAFTIDLDLRSQIRGEQAVQAQPVFHDYTEGPVALDLTVDPRAWWSSVDVEVLAELADTGQQGSGSPEDPVAIPPTSEIANALTLAITTGRRPTFTWRKSSATE